MIRDCIALFYHIFGLAGCCNNVEQFEQKDGIHTCFSINVFTFVFLGRTVKACAGDDYTHKDRAIACDGYIYMLVICFNVMLYHLYVLRLEMVKCSGII